MANQTRNISGTRTSVVVDPSYRYIVPYLDAVPEGKGNGKKMRLENIDAVADALGVLPENLGKFMSVELGAQVTCTATKNEIRGDWTRESVDLAVRKFEDVFIVCPGCDPDTGSECQKPELNVRVSDNGALEARCRACRWRGVLDEKLKYDKVTKNIVKHLSKTTTKWCRNLRGDPPIKREVPGVGVPGPTPKQKEKEVKEKKEKKDKTEKKEKKDMDVSDEVLVSGGLAETGAKIGEQDEPSLPQESTEEELEERHAKELSELEAKMHAHVEAVKASAGKGKKGKEKVEVAEREVEEWSYKLHTQQQAELELLLENLGSGSEGSAA